MNLISTENIKDVPKACSLDVYITESEEIHTHTHTHSIIIYIMLYVMTYIMVFL